MRIGLVVFGTMILPVQLSIFGQEKAYKIGCLCLMNIAVHDLEGDIHHSGNTNSYYDNPHEATDRFDFALANPTFNINAVDKERLNDSVGLDRRFPFGLTRAANANYLWIPILYSALKASIGSVHGGCVEFVVASSTSEQELRRQFIESHAVKYVGALSAMN